jgi:hypothetical protein
VLAPQRNSNEATKTLNGFGASLFLRAVHMRPARENNLSTSHEVPLIANTLRATFLRMGKSAELSLQNPRNSATRMAGNM